ncbi:hypothetical protein NC653_024116 [Populus alba x Populus x berolinensis]|uniref:Uncharacterized protein n=1 Tax=Populus alba x Populus x berolinensis TaxID=444605 RepID=A0AAD6M813_9ROSI|nr:hypothetical protein NC653_024116 [Populus alba x Populus x berolinensis]
MIMKGNGSSMISGSEVEERKMLNKRRSKASSLTSGSENIVKEEENGAFGKASLTSESLTKTDTKSTELDHILKPSPKFTGLDLGSPRSSNFRYAAPKKANFVSKPVITESQLGPSASEVAAVSNCKKQTSSRGRDRERDNWRNELGWKHGGSSI